jgi:hypothetical protein
MALPMLSERYSWRDAENFVQPESAFSATKCWLDGYVVADCKSSESELRHVYRDRSNA